MTTSIHRLSILALLAPARALRRLSWAACAAIACHTALAADSGEGFRTFTSTDGRTVTAKILATKGESVHLEFPGGRRFHANVRHFSDADREHIAAWSPDAAPVKHYSFEVKTTRQRAARLCSIEEIPTCRKNKKVRIETTSDSYTYKVRLVNTSSVDLKDVEVRYKLYRKPEASDNAYQARDGEWEGDFIVKSGSIKLDSLPRLVSRDVSTEPVTIDHSQLDPDWRYTSGKRNSRRDRIAGVWIKIFHKGLEVHETKSSHAALRKAKW